MKWLLGLGVMVAMCALLQAPAMADGSLQLRPLEYREILQKGERKKGFVDVTNPTSQTIDVAFSVKGFKQVNDMKGDLTFFDNQQLRAGIVLDYSDVHIPAKQTLRLYFIIDSTKLPSGDVFAAIFAQTVPNGVGASSSVRLGTLLLLTNGTPGARQAEITTLEAPFLQVGTLLSGRMTVKNTAPPDSASGFFPQVAVRLWPFGPTTTVSGPLLYAGNSREIAFHLPSNQFGLYKLSVRYGSSHQERWVLLVTGWWRWIVLGGIALGIIGGALAVVWRRHVAGRARH